MRMLRRKMQRLWCILTHSCSIPLNDLKRDDAEFASHMNWMYDKQQASSHRRQAHFVEQEFLSRLSGQKGSHDA